MKLSELKKGQRFRFSRTGGMWEVTFTHRDMGWFHRATVQAKNAKGTFRRYYPESKSWNKDVILVAQ